jgi:hypothetical protein
MQGHNQADIAKALGVSVMKFHRWRKAQSKNPRRTATAPVVARNGNGAEPVRRRGIAELQLEYSRLRRLVTDLLLDRMRLKMTSIYWFFATVRSVIVALFC